MNNLSLIFKGLRFAAHKHRDQRRKDIDSSPYIKHPIEVADTLITIGEVEDVDVILGAILHDTLEDTDTTPEEVEQNFGAKVRQYVEEVSDDKTLPKEVRKELQIKHSAELSEGAKQIKIADKICNIEDIIKSPPKDWSLERRIEYLEWATQVFEGIQGCNGKLDKYFFELVYKGKEKYSVLKM